MCAVKLYLEFSINFLITHAFLTSTVIIFNLYYSLNFYLTEIIFSFTKFIVFNINLFYNFCF